MSTSLNRPEFYDESGTKRKVAGQNEIPVVPTVPSWQTSFSTADITSATLIQIQLSQGSANSNVYIIRSINDINNMPILFIYDFINSLEDDTKGWILGRITGATINSGSTGTWRMTVIDRRIISDTDNDIPSGIINVSYRILSIYK